MALETSLLTDHGLQAQLTLGLSTTDPSGREDGWLRLTPRCGAVLTADRPA
jgi:hypothetical protein